MKLKKGELKVFYSGELNKKLDKEINVLLKSHGYKFWASGYDLVGNVRDLAFDKIKTAKSKTLL